MKCGTFFQSWWRGKIILSSARKGSNSMLLRKLIARFFFDKNMMGCKGVLLEVLKSI